MRRFLPLILLVFFSPALVLAETAPAERLDLAAAIREALETDPQIAEAQAGLMQAESAVAAELAKLAPGLTISTAHDVVYYEGTSFERTRTLSFIVSSSLPGLFPLAIGGKAAGAVETAMWDRADAEAVLVQKRIEAAGAAAQKYLAALTAGENLRLAERALGLAREDERIARANLEAGLATRLDVLRAEANTKKAALGLEKAQVDQRTALDALLLQLGRPLGGDPSLAAPGTPKAPPSLDLHTLLASALETRAEILQARTNLRKIEANLVKAKNQALPMITLSALQKEGVYSARVALDLVTGDVEWSIGGDWGERDPTDAWEIAEGLNLGLEFTWQPFDGGARKAQIAALETQSAGARVALARMEKQIELELRQRLNELDLAFRTLEEVKTERDLALEARNLAALRYQEGIALFSELEEATHSLAEAEFSVAKAEYELLLAVVQLDQACGRMPDLP